MLIISDLSIIVKQKLKFVLLVFSSEQNGRTYPAFNLYHIRSQYSASLKVEAALEGLESSTENSKLHLN